MVCVSLSWRGNGCCGGGVALVAKPRNPSPLAVPQLVKKITVETLQGLVKTLDSYYAESRYVTIHKLTVEQVLNLTKVRL